MAYLVRRVNPSGKGDTFLAKVLDARSGKVVSVIDVKGFPALAWSPTGTLALGDDDGIRVLDFEGATTTSLPVVGAPRWLSPTVLSVSPWFGTPQVSLFRADGSAIPLPDGIAPTAVTAVAALGNSVSIGTETGELFQWSSTGWKTLHRANAGVLWMARDERMGTLFYSDGSVHRFNDQASALVWSQGVRRPWGQFDGKVLAVVGSELWAYQPEATPSIARRTSDGAALPSVPLPKGSTWLGNSQDGAMIVAGLPKGDQITQCIMLDQKGQTLLQQSLSAGGCELNDKGTVLFMWDETFLKMLDLKN
ncbi:MAG TPA: hypothetical protein VNT75_21090 [Symbiobacteriaceae bacterium]|nr:hypothetical protein [Symbiobacteriaceae bacterium]